MLHVDDSRGTLSCKWMSSRFSTDFLKVLVWANVLIRYLIAHIGISRYCGCLSFEHYSCPGPPSGDPEYNKAADISKKRKESRAGLPTTHQPFQHLGLRYDLISCLSTNTFFYALLSLITTATCLQPTFITTTPTTHSTTAHRRHHDHTHSTPPSHNPHKN